MNSKISVLFVLFLFSGCVKNEKHGTAFVGKVENTQQPNIQLKKPGVEVEVPNKTDTSESTSSEVTLKKSEIFGKEFLYGADLQHSTMKEGDQFSQAYALGHAKVFFRKKDGVLQLIQNKKMNSESDVNHPERLINSFPVLRESSDSIVIKITEGSPVLRQMFWAADQDQEVRQSWVRSVQFDPNGNYLMIETSVETTDGEIIEHLESIFPRSNLISADDKPLWNDGLLEPLAKRFRFLGSDSIYTDIDGERSEISAAVRFKIKSSDQLKWWVTANVPEDSIRDVQTAVEGWNRYFEAMWGAPVMKFMGRLPSNIKLGDPRYNVVVWDTVSNGDSAWETQASDPETGIQSHSIVYLPSAWLTTGSDYSELFGKTEPKKEKLQAKVKEMTARSGGLLKVRCLYDLNEKLSAASIEDENFGRSLLKTTLLHEVGHGLGLDHNFKGSLTNDKQKVTTSSIMDYNQFHMERYVFDALDSSSGPLLEYDRQILRALYDQGRGLDNATVLPTCNDDEADSETGGVDPLCTRYDSGANPIETMSETVRLIQEDNFKTAYQKSLPDTLNAMAGSLPAADEIKDQAALEAKLNSIWKTRMSLINFYLNSGAQSLRYAISSQLKGLKVVKKDAASDEDNKERAVILQAFTFGVNLSDLPAAAKAAYQKNADAIQSWVQQTEYYKNLNDSEKEKAANIASAIRAKMEDKYFVDPKTAVFQKLRTGLLGSIEFSRKAPFYLAKEADEDYERALVQVLTQAISTNKAGESKRSQAERLAAIMALNLFPEDAKSLVRDGARDALKKELEQSQTAEERQQVRDLLKILQ